MGSIVTCTCEPEELNPEKSLSNLAIKLEAYANNNNLMQFDKNTRKMLEQLFVLNQSHVGDRLIRLTKQRRQEEKKALIADLSKIDLQQFDEICYVTRSAIYLNNLQTKRPTTERELVKIGPKFIEQGEKCLRKMKFLLIVAAMCFGGKDGPNPFQPTDLLSRKSRIQILVQKSEVLTQRYNCDFKICILCPQYLFQQLQGWSSKSIELMEYLPTQPCFSQDNRIKMYGDRIQFNEQEGDLLYYLFNSGIKQSLTQYDYISFSDINNFVSPLLNPAYVGYLSLRPKINILAALKNTNGSKVLINRQFIDSQKLEFGDILVKTSVLKELNKDSKLYQILNMRIERKLMKGFDDCFFFSRLPQDILYADWTQVTKIPYNASNRTEYSNFCKRLMGIDNQNEHDIVQISPCILYADQWELSKLRNALRDQTRQMSFPLLVVKSHQSHH